MRYTFRVGDTTYDPRGHGRIECYDFEINLTKAELLKAFGEGLALMEFDRQVKHGIVFPFCQMSDQEIIPSSFIQKMQLIGLKPGDYFHSTKGLIGEPYFGVAEELPYLWLDIAKVGNPNLVYSHCKNDGILDIGGYSLL